MKVAELDGALLDLWVALADGEVLAPGHPMPDPNSGTYWLKMGRFASVKPCPQYSLRWADGGEIIDRERVELLYYGKDGVAITGNPWEAQIGNDTHYIDQGPGDAIGGPTPLVAAMRAYVTSKFGEEVPDAPA